MPHLSPMNWLMMLLTSMSFIMIMKTMNWWSIPYKFPPLSSHMSKNQTNSKWNWL